eukprot:5273158-Prymnesium_polylepis.1
MIAPNRRSSHALPVGSQLGRLHERFRTIRLGRARDRGRLGGATLSVAQLWFPYREQIGLCLRETRGSAFVGWLDEHSEVYEAALLLRCVLSNRPHAHLFPTRDAVGKPINLRLGH